MKINPRRRRRAVRRSSSKGQRMPGGCAPRPELRAANLRVQALPISQIKVNPA